MQDPNNLKPQDSQDQPADPSGASSSQASPSQKTPTVVSGRPKPARSWWVLVVVAAVLIIPVIGVVFMSLFNSSDLIISRPMTQAQRAAAEQVLDSVRVELESAGFAPNATTTSEPYDCSVSIFYTRTGERTTDTEFEVDRVSANVEGGTLEVADVVARTLEKSGAKEFGEFLTADPNDPGYRELTRSWRFDGGSFSLINQISNFGTMATFLLNDPC